MSEDTIAMEREMRQTLVKALRLAGADPVSVENPACPGTPDVNYVEGWAELKELHEWPARAETNVAIDHFTPQQRVWLIRRSMAHGRVFLVLKVKNEWLCYTGNIAAVIVGRATQEVHRLRAEVITVDVKEVVKFLLNHRTDHVTI